MFDAAVFPVLNASPSFRKPSLNTLFFLKVSEFFYEAIANFVFVYKTQNSFDNNIAINKCPR